LFDDVAMPPHTAGGGGQFMHSSSTDYWDNHDGAPTLHPKRRGSFRSVLTASEVNGNRSGSFDSLDIAHDDGAISRAFVHNISGCAPDSQPTVNRAKHHVHHQQQYIMKRLESTVPLGLNDTGFDDFEAFFTGSFDHVCGLLLHLRSRNKGILYIYSITLKIPIALDSFELSEMAANGSRKCLIQPQASLNNGVTISLAVCNSPGCLDEKATQLLQDTVARVLHADSMFLDLSLPLFPFSSMRMTSDCVFDMVFCSPVILQNIGRCAGALTDRSNYWPGCMMYERGFHSFVDVRNLSQGQLSSKVRRASLGSSFCDFALPCSLFQLESSSSSENINTNTAVELRARGRHALLIIGSIPIGPVLIEVNDDLNYAHLFDDQDTCSVDEDRMSSSILPLDERVIDSNQSFSVSQPRLHTVHPTSTVFVRFNSLVLIIFSLCLFSRDLCIFLTEFSANVAGKCMFGFSSIEN
jgi:hypothetical protein